MFGCVCSVAPAVLVGAFCQKKNLIFLVNFVRCKTFLYVPLFYLIANNNCVNLLPRLVCENRAG